MSIKAKMVNGALAHDKDQERLGTVRAGQVDQRSRRPIARNGL